MHEEQLNYSSAQVAAAGSPNVLNLVLPSFGIPTTLTSGTVRDSVYGSRAQLIIPAGVFSQAETVSTAVLSPLTLPVPHGFVTKPASYYFDVSFSPQPAYPLPSPGITLTLPMVTYTVPGTSLQLFRVDPNLGLVAATDVHGNTIFGTVSSDGMSATFAGVSRFSIHVALEPTGAIPGDVNDDGEWTAVTWRL